MLGPNCDAAVSAVSHPLQVMSTSLGKIWVNIHCRVGHQSMQCGSPTPAGGAQCHFPTHGAIFVAWPTQPLMDTAQRRYARLHARLYGQLGAQIVQREREMIGLPLA